MNATDLTPAPLLNEMCQPTLELLPFKNPGSHSTLREAKRATGFDDFQTPPYAIDWLLPFISESAHCIWEPACGKGNLVEAFLSKGFRVKSGDILTGQDFLGWMDSIPLNCVIVTNPPFSGTNKFEFLRRCYEYGNPFALLMPFAALEGIKRQALYREYGIQMLVPPKRIVFETPSGKKSSPWQAHAWFTWKLNLPSDLYFAPRLEDKP